MLSLLWRLIIIYITFSISLIAHANQVNSSLQNISSSINKELKKHHKKSTNKRLLLWANLIKNNQYLSALEKVKLVNDFFNNLNIVEYAQDIYIWHQADYWATPIEFMLKGYGDCEDYAIAKYFTLIALGIADNKMRITYVLINKHKQGANKDLAHMVLTYYPKGKNIPLILDNMDRNLRPANKRPDLKFIYSFNGHKLWMVKNRKYGVYLGNSRKLSKWASLTKKLGL